MSVINPQIAFERRQIASTKKDITKPAIKRKWNLVTTESLVERFKEVHSFDLYDYSLVRYERMTVNVTIICKRCGVTFEQVPTVHLRGCGCKKCSMALNGMHHSLALEDVIKRVENIGKLRYSSGDYVNQKSVLIFVCEDGHDVPMRAGNALSGRGCAICSGRKDTPMFIEAAIREHGMLYAYPNTIYKGAKSKVEILCRRCNRPFLQLADNHLNGKGCPRCNPGNVSQPCVEWLDSLNILEENREVTLWINGKRFKLDALVGKNAYEFDGDYYHGNPATHDPDEINHKNKKTMRELYEATILKKQILENAGYSVISIWESDWLRSKSIAC